MLNKYKNICLIDGFIVENKNGFAIPNLSKYLKNKHKITLEDYLIKYYFNGEYPKCKCGCGNNVWYNKGIFGKYYKTHKNFVDVSPEEREKRRESRIKLNTVENRLKSLNKTKEEIYLLYSKFFNYEINFTDITKNYKIDKRTLKKFWFDLSYIKDKKEFENICKKHQRIWSDKNNKAGGRQHIDDDLLFNVYNYLKENKGKYTLNEISNKFSLPISSLVLYKRLSENFGEEYIKNLLNYGLSSKPETEYFNILKYFYGSNIKKGFTLEGKFYDFILYNKILIEFDGDYWHNLLKNKINDEIKNNIALKNNYIIFRIKESESKDINMIIKLNKIYEIEVQRSKKGKNKD